MSPMAGPVALKLDVARKEISRVVKDKYDQDVCLKRIVAAHAAMLLWIKENSDK